MCVASRAPRPSPWESLPMADGKQREPLARASSRLPGLRATEKRGQVHFCCRPRSKPSPGCTETPLLGLAPTRTLRGAGVPFYLRGRWEWMFLSRTFWGGRGGRQTHPAWKRTLLPEKMEGQQLLGLPLKIGLDGPGWRQGQAGKPGCPWKEEPCSSSPTGTAKDRD